MQPQTQMPPQGNMAQNAEIPIPSAAVDTHPQVASAVHQQRPASIVVPSSDYDAAVKAAEEVSVMPQASLQEAAKKVPNVEGVFNILDGERNGYVYVAEIVAAHGGDTEGLLRSLDINAQLKYEEWLQYIGRVAKQKGLAVAGVFVRHLGAGIRGNRARGELSAPAVCPDHVLSLSEEEQKTAKEQNVNRDAASRTFRVLI